MEKSELEKIIAGKFDTVYREMLQSDPPQLEHNSVLLDTGLDSLGFTILVSSLEDELGYDPFQISEDSYYPVTFGEFIDFYSKNSPA